MITAKQAYHLNFKRYDRIPPAWYRDQLIVEDLIHVLAEVAYRLRLRLDHHGLCFNMADTVKLSDVILDIWHHRLDGRGRGIESSGIMPWSPPFFQVTFRGDTVCHPKAISVSPLIAVFCWADNIVRDGRSVCPDEVIAAAEDVIDEVLRGDSS